MSEEYEHGLIEAVRKDKTAAKVGGKWYNAEQRVQQYLEKGKEARIEGDKIVFVSSSKQNQLSSTSKQPPQQKQTATSNDKDARITKLAVLNTATEITKLSLQQPVLDEAGNLKTLKADEIAEIVILIAERLEKWVYGG